MRVLRFLLPALFLFTLTGPAVMADDGNTRPKVGLVLSGGGARGGAHIGVLLALEEIGVPVDYIAGTSMGAIIGGMYAAGYSANEIRDILVEMDWEKAMLDRPDRIDQTMRRKEIEAKFLVPYRVGFNDGRLQLPLGVIEGQHLDQVFHEILMPVAEVRDFDQLAIPFRAVATDLVSGEEVVLSGGSLADALRASMSVPGVFAPVEIDERLLIDGGMANNLPVSVVREMGADIVIAVDISSPMLTREEMTSVLSVTEQLTNFLTRRTTDAQIGSMGPDDLLIVPPLGDFSAADFAGAVQIIETGYEATMAVETDLAALAEGSAGSPEKPGVQPLENYVVDFIEVENESVLHDDIIRSRVDVELGQPVDLDALDKSVDRIYSLDVFKSVTYDLVSNDQGEQGVLVKALPRTWGPNYLQFGLELSSDFSGNSDFKLGAAYTRNALNSLGGELRVIGTLGREDEISIDFYQPIDTRAKWFVEPEAYWTRESYDLWLGDYNVAELELSGWGATIGFGRNFGTTDRLLLEYGTGRGDVTIVTGDPGLENGDPQGLEIGELTLKYMHDSLDSTWFPTSGMMHKLDYLYSAESLGAREDFQQAEINGTVAFSIGQNTGTLNYEFGYSFDDKASIERWYRLGGFGRLSGLAPDQLLGRHVALMTLAYYRRLNDMKLVSAFAGATVEAGGAWRTADEIGFDSLRYSGSLFVGAESPLGPVYIAVGYSDNDDFAAYFYVGNPFRVSRFD